MIPRMQIKPIAIKLKLPEKEFNKRADGRIEWVCEHGVGHTVWAPTEYGPSGYVHGCDGCCDEIYKKLKIKGMMK